MNPTIARLSSQALLGRRRGVVLVLIPAVLLLLAVIVGLLTDDVAVGYDAVTSLGFTLALPLVALLAATAVLGPEVDDGSIVYLLSKPVSRHVVAVSKFVIAWAATMVLGALPVLVAGLVLDVGDLRQALAWGVGAAVAGTAYTALFLALAAFTRHAVVVGLLFALLWEGVLGNLLDGIRWLAIGPWGREVAAAVSDRVPSPEVGLTYAVVAAVLVTAGSVWFTGDRLRSFTLRGDE
ncbi:ABC transporter permease [Pedococcus aerophilus]|uniref:ABC transporter permease n=1 Tax=Pedococcus aerophilus TaxID=436356 RepID=A0ABN3US97_9MICO